MLAMAIWRAATKNMDLGGGLTFEIKDKVSESNHKLITTDVAICLAVSGLLILVTHSFSCLAQQAVSDIVQVVRAGVGDCTDLWLLGRSRRWLHQDLI